MRTKARVIGTLRSLLVVLLLSPLLGACGDDGPDDAGPADSSAVTDADRGADDAEDDAGEAEEADDADAEGAEGESRSGGTTVPCTPPPAIDAAAAEGKLPAGVTLPDGARVLAVSESGGSTTVTAESTATVNELHRRFRTQLEGGGATIERQDNEGHEAELFFVTADGTEGSVQQRRVSCPPDTTRFAIALDTGD